MTPEAVGIALVGLKAHMEMCLFHIYYWCWDVCSSTIVNPCLGSTAQRVCSSLRDFDEYVLLWSNLHVLGGPQGYKASPGWWKWAGQGWLKGCGLRCTGTGVSACSKQALCMWGRAVSAWSLHWKGGYIAFHKIASTHHQRFRFWPCARVGHKPVIISPLLTHPDRQNKAHKKLVQGYPVAGAKVRSSECKGSVLFTSPTLCRAMTAEFSSTVIYYALLRVLHYSKADQVCNFSVYDQHAAHFSIIREVYNSCPSFMSHSGAFHFYGCELSASNPWRYDWR